MKSYQLEETEYEIKVSPNENDYTISNLKSRLFDLEQQEKDYNALLQKLNKLKTEYSLLFDIKNKLEQELKQKDESYNQRIDDLRSENENLQSSYNEKMALNKKLFTECDELEKEIELKDAELNDLKNRFKKLKNELGESLADKGDLENKLKNLKNIKNSQAMEINKLIKENKNLSDIVNDQDKKLKKAQEDIAILNDRCNENELDIQNLNGKVRDHINNINSVQKVLDQTNLENRDLNDKIRDYERQCDNFKNDNNNINNTILKERALRCEKERQNKCLDNEINDRDIHINDLSNQLNTVTSLHTQATNDSKNYQLKNDNLKQHIMLLTQQNQKLLNELEVIQEQDYKMKTLLEKKDQSCAVLRGVQSCLEKATICLHKVENDPLSSCCNSRGNSPTHYKSNSPRYTYDRKK